MKHNPKTKRESLRSLLPRLLINGACVVLFGILVSTRLEDNDLYYCTFPLFVIVGLFGFYLHVVLHEAGHLLFGLVTGYTFLSFRIGKLMWMSTGQRIELYRYSFPCTAGQCILLPPDMKDGKMPYVLMNLGGSLMNLITAAVFFTLFSMLPDFPLISLIFIELSIIGIAMALLNGLPMHLPLIYNDGYNILALSNNPEAVRAFWIQMHLSAELAKGVRLRQMPAEWFVMPSPESLKNPMVATLGVLACNRMMDALDFAKADEMMHDMMQMDTGLIGLYHNLMKFNRVYCELVGENRKELLDSMVDTPMMTTMNLPNAPLPLLRTKYAYTLLAHRDIAEAERFKSQFEQTASAYPYLGELAGERELIAYATSRF